MSLFAGTGRFGSGSSSRSGIVLVLVAGILALLLMLAMALIRLAGLSGGIGRTTVLRVSVENAALSGTEYAIARLQENPGWKGPITLESRGDCWRLPVAYAHGEPWEDKNANGVFDAGDVFDPSLHDRDGDGIRDERSGRVRGASGSPVDFTLEVGGLQLCVNDGNPYSNSLSDAHNKPLATLFNALGAVLGEADGSFGYFVAPTQIGQEIRYSDLGVRLVKARPYGGFRTLEEVKNLLSLTGSEWDRLRPLITRVKRWGPLDPRMTAGTDHFGNQSVLEVNGARPEVWQAIWRYRLSRGKSSLASFPAGIDDPVTGLALSPPGSDLVVISRDDAANASAQIENRLSQTGPFESWDDFWGFLDSKRLDIFEEPAGLTAAQIEAYQRARMALLFAAIQPNLYPFVTYSGDSMDLLIPCWTWGRWPLPDEDRFLGKPDRHIEPPLTVSGDPDSTHYIGPPATNKPYQPASSSNAPTNRMLLGFPTHYRILSTGTGQDLAGKTVARHRPSGDGEYQVLGTLYLTSQEDLENLTAALPPHGQGVSRSLGWINDGIVAMYRGTTDMTPGDGIREVASLPAFPQEAFYDANTSYGFSLDTGALAPGAAWQDLPSLVPQPVFALMFDEAGAVPDNDPVDNRSSRFGPPVDLVEASVQSMSLDRLTHTGVSGQGQCYTPFWSGAVLRITDPNQPLPQNSWWYQFRSGQIFPGNVKQAGYPFPPAVPTQTCEVCQLDKALIECWVAESTADAEAVWSVRVAPDFANQVGESGPEMGLRLERAKVSGQWKYRVRWYGPYEPDLYADGDGKGWDGTDDDPRGFRHPDSKLLIDDVVPPPLASGLPSGMRHVALLLDYDWLTPHNPKGMRLYIDGQEVGQGMYPKPIRWVTEPCFLGLLLRPDDPYSGWIDAAFQAWIYSDYGPKDEDPQYMLRATDVRVNLQGADDFRITLDPPPPPMIGSYPLVQARAHDRFLRTATYLSPAYEADGLFLARSLKPLLACWTGVVPKPGTMRVTLKGYDAGGMEILPPQSLPAGLHTRLTFPAAAIDQLRFQVEWNVPLSAVSLIDPAVFEDIQIQYRRTPIRIE